jgi:translation initiation factor 4E
VNIQAGSNYHVFKEGIEPMWEDKANAQGGKWTVEFSAKLRMKQLDQLWLFGVRITCIIRF